MKCNTFQTVARGIPSSQLRRRVDARGVRSMALQIVSTLSWDVGGRPDRCSSATDPVRIHLFTSTWMFCCVGAGFLNLLWKASLNCWYVYTPDNNCNPFYYSKHSGTCKINAISHLEVKNILELYRHSVYVCCNANPLHYYVLRVYRLNYMNDTNVITDDITWTNHQEQAYEIDLSTFLC